MNECVSATRRGPCVHSCGFLHPVKTWRGVYVVSCSDEPLGPASGSGSTIIMWRHDSDCNPLPQKSVQGALGCVTPHEAVLRSKRNSRCPTRGRQAACMGPRGKPGEEDRASSARPDVKAAPGGPQSIGRVTSAWSGLSPLDGWACSRSSAVPRGRMLQGSLEECGLDLRLCSGSPVGESPGLEGKAWQMGMLSGYCSVGVSRRNGGYAYGHLNSPCQSHALELPAQ